MRDDPSGEDIVEGRSLEAVFGRGFGDEREGMIV
jgi:hypothetical protein